MLSQFYCVHIDIGKGLGSANILIVAAPKFASHSQKALTRLSLTLVLLLFRLCSTFCVLPVLVFLTIELVELSRVELN